MYARISDDTEGRAAGVARQVEDSLALAKRAGWSLSPYEPFVDNDISASTRSKARRPAFERLIELIEAGEIDGIVFYSNSRLTRRPREFEDIIDLVERTGLKLNSVVSGQADLSTADGRQIARMLAAADAAEAERTSERVTRAFVQRRQEGKPNPSSRAFGFEKGGMTVRQDEAELIREAATRIADEGWSLGQVVADWNRRKVPTVRAAGGWTRITLARALKNPRSAGLVAHDGEVLGRGSFEQIITPELQERVKAALTGNRNGHTVSYSQRKHALAGFLVCGKCGKPMKVNGLYNPDGSYRKDSYIVCSRSQFGCGNVKRNLLHVEEHIDSIIRARIELAVPTGDVEQEDAAASEVAELQAALDEVEEDIAEHQAEFKSNPRMRLKDYNATLAMLRDRQDAIESALASVETGHRIDPDFDLLAAWEDGSVEERRAVLEWAVDHIKLHPIGRVGPTKAKALVPTSTEVVPRRR
ncbi:serine integrase [Streptomyces phage Itza]|nr:serine integrase [Streptomyces phage Urza]QJD50615.1 serine integrase [Streptomyces phage Itza]